jgi:MFS family permease
MSNLLAQSEQSTGGGLFQTAGQVGSALGICLTTLIASHSPGMEGLRHAFWFTAACGWMVVLFVAVGLRKVGLAKDVAKA